MDQPGTAVEVHHGIGWLVFTNLARHNAIAGAMITQACAGLETLAADATVRCIALRGAGDKAFVSGADIAAFATGDHSGRREGLLELTAAIHRIPKPVVAVVHGWCLGAGMAIAVSCDLRIGSAGARFGIPAAKLGLAYPVDAVVSLVDLVGRAYAGELLFGGEQIDAARAAEIGLLNRVVGGEDFWHDATRSLVAIAANAPLTHAASKASIAAARDPGRAAEATALVAACFESEDFREGQAAFADKRTPTFEGR